ncbi:hypothetical protein ACFVTY_34365 [Streptomyces sp. NPDC058067]|uniref:hypothetical protein n=1 Tax=Streptomyces sp. NPDC058067 TaxID=3346324 RepID=UPI0036EA0A14
MGCLWDKLNGTKYPVGDVAPISAAQVRATLLALNGADVTYRVRKALPAEKADLVAECHIRRVGVRLKTRMRLIPEKQEVRFLHERWENRPFDSANEQYGRGHAPTVYREWQFEPGPDGKQHKVEAFRFDTREMTDSLQRTVLEAGWTWRGVFKL